MLDFPAREGLFQQDGAHTVPLSQEGTFLYSFRKRIEMLKTRSSQSLA